MNIGVLYATLIASLLASCSLAWKLTPQSNPIQTRLHKQIMHNAKAMAAIGVSAAFVTCSAFVAAPSDTVYAATSSATVVAQQQGSIFSGKYSDPNHPGCFRKIEVKGKEVKITGSDRLDGSNQWTLYATEDAPGTILVDFSPKGGPKDLFGTHKFLHDGTYNVKE